MQTKQKITSFLFIALLLMPVLLCSYFLWQQHSIKEEMEKKLEGHYLTSLTILKKNIQWIEEGKELIINGEMFDVKSIEEVNGTFYIKGLYDVAEKKIKQKIALFLHKKNTNDSPLQKLITQFFNPLICVENKLEIQIASYRTISKKYFSYIESILFCKLEISSPPPNQIL